MRKEVFIFAFVVTCGLIAGQSLNAGTIPAGTVLSVRTMNTIYSKDRVGRKFTAQLDHDIVVKGTVVARAGTKFVGRVETSTNFGPHPLTVNLTHASVDGKEVSVHTTGAFEPQSLPRGRRNDIQMRNFVLPPGAILQFHLAQPLTI